MAHQKNSKAFLLSLVLIIIILAASVLLLLNRGAGTSFYLGMAFLVLSYMLQRTERS
ncbi:MAG: hypothetical protein HY366_00690 [Candidatus Aenigmarchaeota archaeon]|nr:hypothetical protein [Candidatus Aenigmarchaeota archaeon]